MVGKWRLRRDSPKLHGQRYEVSHRAGVSLNEEGAESGRRCHFCDFISLVSYHPLMSTHMSVKDLTHGDQMQKQWGDRTLV